MHHIPQLWRKFHLNGRGDIAAIWRGLHVVWIIIIVITIINRLLI